MSAECSSECGVCGEDVKWHIGVNFTVYCPKCKNAVHNECEKGYGPVTPYYFRVCDDVFAKVDIGKDRKHFLYLPNETIALKKTYFDAVLEAGGILAERYGFRGFE